MEKKVKKKNRTSILKKAITGVIAGAVALSISVGVLQTAVETQAATIADANTTTKYTASLGNNASTEYAGRIWTDKSVWSENRVNMEVFGGTTQEITKNTNEDFLISFSALSTSEAIQGETETPMDVVFIFDMSSSMNKNALGGSSTNRLYHAVIALNDAMEALLEDNEHARVAVVIFNKNATTILPLDHYEKLNGADFFVPQSKFGSEVYVRAKGTNKSYNTTMKTAQGTNIQRALYQGMNILATEQDKTEIIGDKEITRIPSVVLLSDGEPSVSSQYQDWWNIPDDNNNTSTVYWDESHGMKAIMTGAYMKDAIDRNYYGSVSAGKTMVYSIGIGLSNLSEEPRQIAYATVDPANHIDANNDISREMKAVWNTYSSGKEAKIDGERYDFTFKHPKANDITSINYVDDYYDANNADEVIKVFDEVVQNITISAPQVPTEHDASEPMKSGYITYTDPIGEYMEVKDFKAILYGGQKYTAHTKTTVGNVTTYKFTEIAEGNEVYGKEELENIIIEVRSETMTNDIVKQTLTIKIPASLIPLRINYVKIDEDGNVETHTNNGAYPIRVFYTVGMQDKVKTNIGTERNPEYIVNTEVLEEGYIENNANADGTINFYSNLYSGNPCPYEEGKTIGDATAVFDAASTNPFYYLQEDLLLYTDAAATMPAKGPDLEAGKDYYYKETYYEGLVYKTAIVKRSAEQLENHTIIIQKADGNLYRQAGSVRVNHMLEFAGEKNENDNTGTATDFYTPTYDRTTGHFKVYLGNNGLLTMKATGNLAITKTVTAASGLTAPEKEFTYTVELKNSNGSVLSGEYNYTVTNSSGTVSTGKIQDGNVLKLKADQTVVITGLPANAKYKVTETTVVGFVPSVKEHGAENFVDNKAVASGTIEVGETADVSYTNHYTATPAVITDISGTKILKGRPWDSTVDSYTFQLVPYTEGAPEPAVKEITVTSATNNKAEFSFDFDNVLFTVPGEYRYMIVEKEPDNDKYAPGVTYSNAMYRLIVNVVDQGNGTLKATTDVQKLYTDDAAPLFSYDENNNLVLNSGQEAQDEVVFTNIYNAASVVRVPLATKNYVDHSGSNPLTSGMFKFKITPLGVVEDGILKSDFNIPQPEVLTTENEGTNITFLPVEFKKEDIPDGKNSITFRYRIEEVMPETATAENGYTVNGMKYDPNVFEMDVIVSIDPSSSVLKVDAIYPNNQNVGVFHNEYSEKPTTVNIQGTKYLTGREILEADQFAFKLEAADEATSQAISDGNVMIPVSKATTAIARGTSDEDGDKFVFDFSSIEFKKQGEYKFNITEIVPVGAADNGDGTYTYQGIIYDSHVCEVTVNVTDADKNGELDIVTPVYSDGTTGAVFHNTYSKTFDKETAISFNGNKTLTGKELVTGEFFLVVKTTEPDGTVSSKLVPNQSDGKFEILSNEEYTSAGTYTYEIQEQVPNNAVNNQLNGITYSTAIYEVIVDVQDDNKGNLKASIRSVKKGAEVYAPSEDGAYTLEFLNEYKTKPATIGAVTLTKELIGRNWTEKDSFEFELSVVEATPSDGVVLPETTKLSVTKLNIPDGQENGAIVQFGNITFTKEGTYVLQVNEIPGNNPIPGITYSTNVFKSTFDVKDDGRGNLIAVRKNSTGSPIFKNEYSATGQLETDVVIQKVFRGLEWTNDTKFAFVLAGHDDLTRTAIENGKIILPATDAETRKIIENSGSVTTSLNYVAGITIKKSHATLTGGQGDQLFTEAANKFDKITFTEAGIYTFHIREIRAGEGYLIPGVDYDGESRILTFNVADNGNGTLSVSADGLNTLQFENVFNPEDVILPGHGNLHVVKNILDREWNENDSFNFTIEADLSHNDTAAAITANEIVMDEPLTLTLTKDNKDYGHFGNITFSTEGIFQFIVKEITPNPIPDNGLTYDSNQKTVQVSVIREGTVYRVSVIDVIDSNNVSNPNKKIEFQNIYNPKPVEISGETSLQVQKILDGREWKAGDKFKFVLNAMSDDSTGIVENIDGTEVNLSTQSAREKGYVVTGTTALEITSAEAASFGDIKFTKPGVYTFEIEEIVPEGTTAGITYDEHVEFVTITVTDTGLGNLVAAVSGTSKVEGTDAIVHKFTNKYKATPTTALIEVHKSMSGRELLTTDGFEFLIRANSETPNAPLPSNVRLHLDGSSDKVGDIFKGTFGSIRYTTEGTYKYKVSEAATGGQVIPGVTYDPTIWDITVIVTDDGNGALSAAVDYGTEDNQPILFTNVYAPSSETYATVKLGTKKVLNGKELSENMFQFTLEAASGNPEGMQMPDSAVNGIVTAGNKEDGSIDFGILTFTKTGTYKAIVKELANDVPGVSYDNNAEREVTFVVTDDHSGKLKVAVDSAETDSLKFVNNYLATPASTVVNITKEFIGRAWTDTDKFEFVIEAEDAFTKSAVDNDKVILPEKITIAKSDIDGSITEDNKTIATNETAQIRFDQAGIYKFRVREIAGAEPTITYDASKHVISVEVKDNGAGALVIHHTEGLDNLKFVNTYKPNEIVYYGHDNLDVVKVLTGREWNENDVFTFELAPQDTYDNVTITKDTVTIDQNTVGKTAHFGNIIFELRSDKADSAEGTYVFNVREVVSDDEDNNHIVEGVRYDAKLITVEIVVTYNSSEGKYTFIKTFKEEDTTVSEMKFINEYEVAPTSIAVPEITKELVGRNWKDTDEFVFTLNGNNEKTLKAIEDEKIVLSKDSLIFNTNMSDHTDSFGRIQFKEAGYYEFVIEEEEGSIAGIEYSSHKVLLRVDVIDDGKGNLEAKVNTIAPDDLIFVNTYTPAAVTAIINGEKILSGRDFKADDKFSFEITAKDGAPLPSATTVEVNGSVEAIETDNTEKQFTFAPITYTEAGTYEYTIKEVAGNIPGIIYDSGEVTVIVVVEYDNDKGVLTEPAISYTKAQQSASAATFTNEYISTQVTAVVPEIAKELSGRAWKADEVFNFELKAADTITQDAIDSDAIELNKNSVGITSVNAEQFGEITFHNPGTYKFEISEVNGNIPGITYDGHKVLLEYVVTDSGVGTLVVSASEITGELLWKNTYSPESVSVGLNGTKVLQGRSILETDGFTFTIEKAEGTPENTPLPAHKTVIADTNGEIVFGAMPFTETGIYKYIIVEHEESIPGVSFDKNVVYVTINVSDNTSTGKLEATVVCEKADKADEESADTFTFVNTYSVQPTDPVSIFHATKVIDASEGNSFTLKGGDFSFEIIPKSGLTNDPIAQSIVTNDADGNICFAEEVIYSAAGKYIYDIREVQGSKAGVSYDGSIYSLIVNVTDDNSGKLQITYTINKGNVEVGKIEFKNNYNPSAVAVAISGTKNLEGKDLVGEQFEFKLEPITEGAPMPTSGNNTTKNAEGGSFAFDSITYTSVGTYQYKVTEVPGAEVGYTYDNAEYIVTVEITDHVESVVEAVDEETEEPTDEPEAPVNDGSGSLKATVTIDNATEIIFNNNYHPIKTEVTLGGIKELTGREMKDGEFTFVLKDGEDKIIQETSNRGNEFAFKPIEFTKVDTYYYTITEKLGDAGGVTYDESGYQVEVVVTDKNGYLSAEISYADEQGNEANNVSFVNQYEAKPTAVQMGAVKVLRGRPLKDGEFTFELLDELGAVIDTVKNTADGKVMFKKIEYTSTGVYHYTIREVQDKTLSHVTYDSTVYNVIVNIIDEGQGQLNADMAITNASTGEAAEAIFTNIYKKPTVPENPTPETPDESNENVPEYYPAPTTTTYAGGSPTGDISDIGLFSSVILVTLCGFTGITFYKRKKH